MPATIITIEEHQTGQRLDNFLITRLKGLPKQRIYRAIRSGEVRVNKGRVKPEYRIKLNDQVRIPPLQFKEVGKTVNPSQKLMDEIEKSVIFENNEVLIINKPSGIAVHGGGSILFGVIDVIRAARPKSRFLELAHRLDQDTSGCLVIAKKRSALVELHRLLLNRAVTKHYHALVKGRWEGGQQKVEAPLITDSFRGSERFVKVGKEGKPAVTVFTPIKIFEDATLVCAKPVTGRTHQIRVHAAHIGHPIAGDDKYGDGSFNQLINRLGLKRLFLHSASISWHWHDPKEYVGVCAIMDVPLLNLIEKLTNK